MPDQPPTRRERQREQTAAEILAAARALRRWALTNRSEFTLPFGKPVADAGTAPTDPAHEASWRFGQVFLGLMARLWAEGSVSSQLTPEPAPLGGPSSTTCASTSPRTFRCP
ncbi:WHG domain-containing protein [Kitasatospora sp. NPDC047058]|uniref:WHG domain-containing protein n=1 Tax=Kitasatospora sp. NPDC047058 TaxID=3155620 RepID=UPI0033E75F04